MASRKRTTKAPATSSPGPIAPLGYADFLAGIKQQIRQRQYRALRAVNHELVALYWELGESICRKQEEQGWGRSVVENLARDLQAEFPGRNGFSATNIWLTRQFYLEYHDKPILQPLLGEISWAKYRVILGRCKDDLAREFYLRAAARFGWTKAVLQHQIDNQTYEKYLLGQTNFDQAAPESVRAHAVLAVKDHYTFDFLELADRHHHLPQQGEHRRRVRPAHRGAPAGRGDLHGRAATAGRLQGRPAQPGVDRRTPQVVGCAGKRGRVIGCGGGQACGPDRRALIT